jgi:hypothetical protein
VKFDRRRFVQALGLGAGAGVLAPIADTLIGQAHAQAASKPRVIFVLEGNGWNYERHFKPDDIEKGNEPLESTTFTMPASVKALEPYRDRMLWVDGLVNAQHKMGGHFGLYVGMSCLPMQGLAVTEKSESGGTPGGISIDQYLANTVGKNALFKSVEVGATSNKYHKDQSVINFPLARGPNEPVSVDLSPSKAFARLFGGGTAAGSADALKQMNELKAKRKRIFFDYLRDDINRLNTRLAGSERQKLEQYLNALETIETRQLALLESGAALNCKTQGFMDGADIEERLAQAMDVATLAISCGLTQVATVLSGVGRHFDVTFTKAGVSLDDDGQPHDKHSLGHGGGQPDDLPKLHNFHADLIKKMIDQLVMVKEGETSVFDQTTIVFMNENGEQHHARHFRWPALLIGEAGGKIKTGGRFVRLPAINDKNAARHEGVRSLADLFITLTHAVGAPNDKFSLEGATKNQEQVRGVIPGILA